MRQPQGREGRRRDITVRDHDMVRGAMRCAMRCQMRCHMRCPACALPVPCHEGFAVLSSSFVSFLGPSDAVGDDGGSKWAAGSWQLTPGQAGWMTECRCRRDCTWGGILITLMHPVQAGGRAGGLAGWPRAHSRTHMQWQDTARSRRQQPAPRPANSAWPGTEVAAADPIDIQAREGESCQAAQARKVPPQQAQESAHVA